MKRYSFSIDQWQVEKIFKPIRKKEQIIHLLMNTIKTMLINEKPKDNLIEGKIVLVISKMSRVFYFSEDKYFSINFPFSVIKSEMGFIFSSGAIDNIDHEITSHVISVISSSNSFETNCMYGFLDIIEKQETNSQNLWEFLLKLFLFEDGYIRYDYDEKNENGLIHPLTHYDIFYTSNSTFKIGLHDKITKEQLIDFLKIESNCYFLE